MPWSHTDDDYWRKLAEDEKAKNPTEGGMWRGRQYTKEQADAETQRVLDQRRAEQDPYNIDPNLYEYGGRKGYADQVANYNRTFGNDAAGRQAASVYGGQPGANMLHSRQNFSDTIGLLRGAADGSAPSQAAALMSAGTDQSIAAQQAMANSTRGGAAASLAAQRQAAGAANDLRAQNVNQMAALRANEMATARGQLAGASGQLYGQDIGLAGQQLGANMQQRELNDKYAVAREAMAQQAEQAQLNAQSMMGNTRVNAQNVADATRASADAARRQADSQTTGHIVGGASAALGAMAIMSDERAKKSVAVQAASDGYKAGYAQAQQEREGRQDRMTTERVFGGASTIPQLHEGIEVTPDPQEPELVDDTREPPKPPEYASLVQSQKALVPTTFKYRDGGAPGPSAAAPNQTYAGVMAQDALRHPVTASMVRKAPNGALGIDIPSGLSYALASEALNSRRLERLERTRGGGRR